MLRVQIVLLMAAAPFALGQARIDFMRRIPAQYDLSHLDEIAIVYGIGDNDSVETFVAEFIDHTNRFGPIHLSDATAHGAHFIGQKPDDRTITRLKREHPADAYLGVNRFSCDLVTRTGEGSTTDFDGARVRRKHEFVDARCHARIDVFDAKTGERTLTFDASGEGTSPRVEKVGDEEMLIARESAARYAGISAAEAITPREVRETIQLDTTAPLFARGMALIDADRLDAARALWEGLLTQYPASAPLLYDIAAVAEAQGDAGAACTYLERAMSAAPGERKYHDALRMLRRRSGK
jgi:tetratricopeptide (TPR) repeat protein